MFRKEVLAFEKSTLKVILFVDGILCFILMERFNDTYSAIYLIEKDK